MLSSSKRYSASALANSVLPTPVVPRNIKEPIGFLGSFNPARLRRTASATAIIASSWPTTRWCRCSSRCNNFSRSLCIILLTGMPVALATLSAISSASTSSFNSLFSLLLASCLVRSAIVASSFFILPYRISATLP